ncbi:unnamed protein product [Notodromas monacha]|uniref:Major facilitator superfamily (MFS) profile domain-containing protein n=1 Tax=Notodromas monacha TaxID=399045 RepID=A0A7R9BIQ0_9CRUS|nr:unnamed protein product [Notodromas monacha]CAG0914667.1 unnamed protein product [Notodromas monacha]
MEESLDDAPIFVPLSGFSVRNQLILAFCATSGSFAVGMALAWSSPVLPVLEAEMHLSLDQVSWIGSLIALGALCGGMPAGWMMERYGRRTSLLFISLPFAVGWIGLMSASSVYLMYSARFLIGLCCAGCLVIVPTYIGETAHLSWRGKLGALMQVMIVTGVLASYVIGAVLPWRWTSVCCCGAVAVFAILISRMPESPAFLCKHERRTEARRVLKWLRGPKYDIEPELRAIEREDYESKLSGEFEWRNIAEPAFYRPLFVSVALMFNQQLSGVNNVIFYSAAIFRAAGSSMNENLAAILVGLAQFIACLGSASIIDHLGRKPLLLASNLLSAVALYAMGIFFYWKDNADHFGQSFIDSWSWLPLVACVAFMVFFSLALGPVPWVMMGELFPVKYRGTASGISTMMNWAGCFLITKTFAFLQASIGLGVSILDSKENSGNDVRILLDEAIERSLKVAPEYIEVPSALPAWLAGELVFLDLDKMPPVRSAAVSVHNSTSTIGAVCKEPQQIIGGNFCRQLSLRVLRERLPSKDAAVCASKRILSDSASAFGRKMNDARVVLGTISQNHAQTLKRTTKRRKQLVESPCTPGKRKSQQRRSVDLYSPFGIESPLRRPGHSSSYVTPRRRYHDAALSAERRATLRSAAAYRNEACIVTDSTPRQKPQPRRTAYSPREMAADIDAINDGIRELRAVAKRVSSGTTKSSLFSPLR